MFGNYVVRLVMDYHPSRAKKPGGMAQVPCNLVWAFFLFIVEQGLSVWRKTLHIQRLHSFTETLRFSMTTVYSCPTGKLPSGGQFETNGLFCIPLLQL